MFGGISKELGIEADDEHSLLFYEELKAETGKAVLFGIGDEEYWIQKSMIGEYDKPNKVVQVKKWYYDKHFL